MTKMNKSYKSRSRNPWVYEFIFSPDNETTLICFPYAGGNTHGFASWEKVLPQGWNLLSIQYPGRLSLMGLPPEKKVNSLVQKIYENVRPYLENKKIIFFGHSLGALVSFELSKLMERKGHDPITALFVSACVSPDLVGKEEGIHHLSDDDFLKIISKYGGTPNELLRDKELMNFFVPVLKSDFCMYETYEDKHDESVQCPLIAIGSHQDTYAPVKEMRNWKNYTSHDHKLIPVQGDHFYIHDQHSNFAELFQISLGQIFEEGAHYGSE